MAFKPKSAPVKSAGLTVCSHSCEWKDGKLFWTYTPPTLEQAKSIPWRPIWCAGYDLDGQGKKHFHHIECIPCHCPPGPQFIAIQHEAFEVACAGGRGSAKSEGSFGFLTKGNPIHDPTRTITGVDASYLASSDYRFLVLRKNYKDLLDYLERAKKFFGLLGAKAADNILTFPSGARGVFDHLADSDSYEKYQGQEFVRIVLEEATQIPNEELYLKILMSCRSARPELREQVMLTANPGGPGARWFNARFVDLKHANGKPVKMGETYSEPLIDDKKRSTRVLIFSTVDDNPYLLSKGYDKQLELLRTSQPTLYKRWRHGDMKAIEGAYFECFREKRLDGEPENALHVVPPVKLDDYWPRAIACDWGYSHPSAVMWGCWHPKRQLYVYREYVTSRMGATELGAEIAKRSLPELQRMPNPHMNLYLSHDAFARTNEAATEAEQIAMGIERILGPDAAFVLAPDESESFLDDEVAWTSIRKRQIERSRKTNITLINAGMKRRGNMNRIREYMRWMPIESERMVWDDALARRILQAEGALAYSDYQRKCERADEETLPKLQIFQGCDMLIGSIQGAIEAKNDPEQMEKQDGDDPVDALAYLVGNFNFQAADAPREVQLAQKLDLLRAERPGISTQSLIMAARYHESEMAKHDRSGAFSIRRNIVPRRALARVN